ncbi:MAG: choice-of-anchor L domain-containing protein [Crocinitomicaceae bacterium]|nr:choice-of-anchor L domain-containing protein [Crocinitomicaceae bacterium]
MRWSILIAIPAIVLFFSTMAMSQLVVNNAVNGPDGLQNYLLGPGVVATNVVFYGNNNQVASFNCNNCNLGISSGLMLSTGNANSASGPNNSDGSLTGTDYYTMSADPDIDAISAVTNYDPAILQFDFVPSGSQISFKFVFASEEYLEFANTSFNDSFGFFLSGPGISGPFSNQAANIALIPGSSTPISINNLNSGSYYVNNGDGYTSPYNSSSYYIQPDGFTTVIEAKANVQCGQTYHFKIAIADGFDGIYDSYVFLKNGSFTSTDAQMSAGYIPPNLSPGVDMVYEGCEPAMLTFTRPVTEVAATSYAVTISGTATNGVDYNLIGSTLNFGANQSVASIPIVTTADDIFEGNETVIVSLSGMTACGEPIAAATYTVTITDLPSLSVTTPDAAINCGQTAVLTPQITGGIGYYHITWEDGSVGDSYSFSPSVPTSVSFVVTDTCGVIPFEGVGNVVFAQNSPLLVDIGPDLSVECLDSIFVSSVVSGGYAPYSYEWTNNGTYISEDVEVEFAPSAGLVQLEVTDACGTQSQDQLTVTMPPIPVFVNVGPDQTVNCQDQASLSAEVSGGSGTGNYSYTWMYNGSAVGNDTVFVFDASSIGSYNITLVVTDECNNAGNDVIALLVPPVPVVVNAGSDVTTGCLDTSTLTGEAEGGVGSYSYSWSDGTEIISDSLTTSYHTYHSITVTLTVVDECGNTSSDDLDIIIPVEPIEIILTQDTSICLGESVQLIADVSGGEGTLLYQWSPFDSEQNQITVTPSQTTVYTFSAMDVCQNEDSESVTIGVSDVEAGFTVEYINDTGIELTEQCTYAESYIWHFNDGSTDYGPVVYHPFSVGPITVTLVALGEFGGCPDSVTKSFYPPGDIYVPNTFTPNGDGINDFFFAQGHDIDSFRISIFNRWGDTVFHSENLNVPWNGSYRDSGYFVPDGIYNYLIVARDHLGNVIEKKGFVQILR